MLENIFAEIVSDVFGVDAGSRWLQSLNFFVYDSIKILLLLFFMITILGFLRTYIPQHRIKNWLLGRKYGFGNLAASIFGVITPFCSCSSIPIFLSSLKSGVPLGVTLSFLITSPLVNEYLVVLMLGFFGWKITLAYVVSGMVIGTFSGMMLGRLKLERHLVKDLFKEQKAEAKEVHYNSMKQRVRFGIDEAGDIIRKFWYWILLGVGLGALIHNYVPAGLIQGVVSKGGIWAIPLAVVVGVPMYAGCAAIVPIAVVLFDKGVPLGTALAFMMATAALSFPEAVILRRAMRIRLILVFFGVVSVAIMITGYLLNWLQYLLII